MDGTASGGTGPDADSVFTLNGDIVEFNFVSGNWDTEITFQVWSLVEFKF